MSFNKRDTDKQNDNRREDSEDYRQLFLSDAPMLDLRAPVEFSQGSFTTAINLPLMSDDERHQVGCCYKQQGQQAAIKLGHQLVSGEVRQRRLASWIDFVKQHPQDGYLFCFRGGLRSQTVQSWLAEAGYHFPLVAGGYKSLRRFLIDSCERLTETLPFYILSGLTGSAKTPLLIEQNYHIDLEALANHRGSSFGRQVTPQPTQVNFENQLSIYLLKLEAKGSPYLLLEDESRLIGARSTPINFYQKMCQAPLILLNETQEYRVENILQEYVKGMHDKFCASDSPDPFTDFSKYLLGALDKVKKRLGGEGHQKLRKLMEAALAQQQKNQNSDLHRAWIGGLLGEYYDPMYRYQLQKKKHRIIFQGDRVEVREYFRSLQKQAEHHYQF